MKITRESPVTGKLNTLDIDITLSQLLRWRKGELVQDVAPHLSAEEREFLISGATAEDWETLFG